MKKLPEKSPLPARGSCSWQLRYFDVGDEVTLTRDVSPHKMRGDKVTITKVVKNNLGRVSYRAGDLLIFLEDVVEEGRATR